MYSREKHPDSIYGLSSELLFPYSNPSWFIHSKNNTGEPDLTEKYSLGTPIESSLLAESNPYYMDHYHKILKSGELWHNKYECYSVGEMRIITQ